MCVVAAVACLGLAAVGPVAGAQEDETSARPDVFRSSASAFVAQAFLDREALIPVPEAFRFIALDTSGTYESSNQTARASIVFPGNGVLQGPNLLCSTFGNQFPPEFAPVLDACLAFQYPLTARADSLAPDQATQGAVELGEPGDPFSGRAVRAVAHAAADASTGEAAMTDLRVLGLPGLGSLPLPLPGAPELDTSILSVDGATSRTDQRIDANGALVVEAESILDGVRLVGGLVEIDAIHSTARITDDGEGGVTRAADLEIGDVTVGGIPARLTEDGLEIGSPTGSAGPLVQQLTQLVNELVRGLGIEVSVLATEDGVDDAGVSFARVGGVLVEFAVDLQGLPSVPGPLGDIDLNGIYKGNITIGQAGATGIATDIEPVPFTPAPSTPPDGGFVAPPDAVDTGGPSLTPVVPDAPDTPTAPTPDRQMIVSVLDELYAGRIELVYLAFTLLGLAVGLSPRFALPARLPGARP